MITGVYHFTSKAASPSLSPTRAITVFRICDALEEQLHLGFTNPCLPMDHHQLSAEIHMSALKSTGWRLSEGVCAVCCYSRIQGLLGVSMKDSVSFHT